MIKIPEYTTEDFKEDECIVVVPFFEEDVFKEVSWVMPLDFEVLPNKIIRNLFTILDKAGVPDTSNLILFRYSHTGFDFIALNDLLKSAGVVYFRQYGDL